MALKASLGLQNEGAQAYALSEIANIYIELNNPRQAAEQLKMALQIVANLQNDRRHILGVIANTTVKLQ